MDDGQQLGQLVPVNITNGKCVFCKIAAQSYGIICIKCFKRKGWRDD